MLQTQIGSGFQASLRRFLSLVRISAPRWFPVLALALLGGFGAATAVRARRRGQHRSQRQRRSPPRRATGHWRHFVPRDNLIFYVNFDGLDAHSEAWRKTAAYKMLNQTPLGVMLEEVAAQLLDKPLAEHPQPQDLGWPNSLPW